MDIMSRLLKEKPRRGGSKRVDEQYRMTKEMLPQIEAAQSAGYSWTQICKAAMEEAIAAGRWNEGWNRWDIEKNYRRIKKEVSVNG